MWLTFEIFINVWQSFLIIYFLHKQLDGFHSNYIPTVTTILALSAFLSSYLFYDIPIIDTFGFLLPFFYGCLCFQSKWYICLFWTGTMALLIIGGTTLFSALCSTIWQISPQLLTSHSTYRIAYVIGLNVFLLICTILIIRFSEKTSHPTKPAFLLLVFLNIIILFIIELFFSQADKFTDMLAYTLICLSLFLCAVVSIVLYEFMSKNAEQQQRYKILLNNLKLKQQLYEEEKNMYGTIRVLCHDMKHYVQLITSLVEEHNSETAIRYVNELQSQTDLLLRPSTGNISVDAIIMAKEANMRANNIKFSLQSYPLSTLPINEADFCILLGNILDNAVEGILRTNTRSNSTITLKLACSWDMFHITCTNPCNPSTIQISHGHLLTSKASGNHGLGMQSIANIITKAEGHLRYQIADQMFIIDIVLPHQRRS